jgi:radical SAM superfamily enzyme YgiQ (UPF0313 family)
MICPAYPATNIYSRIARLTTSLGSVCVATAVNEIAGWDAEIIDENNYRRGPKDAGGKPNHRAIQQARPADVVGLYGGLTSTIPRLFEIAHEYRKLGVRTVAGGQHFVEENIEQALRGGVDVVVIGEGEKTIAELLSRFEKGGDLAEVRGIAFLQDGKVVRTAEREPLADFDLLPIPDFSLLRYGRMKVYPVSGIRGCGMDCEFCTVKGKPRFASPERMLEQFALNSERSGAKYFFIVDDLFGQNRRETLRLCRMLRDYQADRGVRFRITVQIRLDRARDSELLTAMREARITNLAIGFESPIAAELEAMSKRLNPEEMVALTRLYDEAGFMVHGMFIFGYPAREDQPFTMSAEDRVQNFLRFIKESRLDTVQVLLPVPLPGTALTRRLRAQNRIYSTQTVGLEYYDGNFPLFEPDAPLTAEGMQQAVRKIMGRFYRPTRMFAIALHILCFLAITFPFHKIRPSWQRWRRKWSKSCFRIGGWFLMRKWAAAFKGSQFLAKLAHAKKQLQPV